jgi:hypothetical protein
MYDRQLGIVGRMKEIQDLYMSSEISSPVIFFDNQESAKAIEPEKLISLVKRDYKEDISDMVKKGISLNSIVVVSAGRKGQPVSVDIINRPHNRK